MRESRSNSQRIQWFANRRFGFRISDLPFVLLLWLLTGQSAPAQSDFTSGSNGSGGALNVTADTTLPLPPDGLFHFTTINVADGATLRFERNALNTPVHLLATGDVTIDGTIDVSGGNGTASPPAPGLGGPGGFDGGSPGRAADGIPPGAGFGPGAGRGGNQTLTTAAGGAAYGTSPTFASDRNGQPYGNPLLLPMFGGSGGGGFFHTTTLTRSGGGGGGGAVLIASTTRIRVGAAGTIRALGGNSLSSNVRNNGSGGAIRLVAPEISGDGLLDVSGGVQAGSGRIRIDAVNRRNMNLKLTPSEAATLGGLMLVFPDPLPRLDIIEAAGTVIPEGAQAAVLVKLPFGSDPGRTVVIQGRDFNAVVPVQLVMTPEAGEPTIVETQIDNRASNPATVRVNVTLPVNVPTTFNAWTK
ncbi:MAG: hypothetical protein HYY24_15070 [Verrucomicrobia bacterium]|nr:hypothetical protein [Verrucomicrobiota bacterium]